MSGKKRDMEREKKKRRDVIDKCSRRKKDKRREKMKNELKRMMRDVENQKPTYCFDRICIL